MPHILLYLGTGSQGGKPWLKTLVENRDVRPYPEPRSQSEGLVAPALAVLSLQEGVHLLTVPAQCTAPLQYGNAVPEGGGGRREAGRWGANDTRTQGPRTHGRGSA